MNSDMERTESTFEPMAALRNRHMMTIFASRWSRSFPDILKKQEKLIVEVASNAKVLVEFNDAQNSDGSRSLAIILHGLEGSSRSHYVLGLAEKLLSAGISTARMNMRNCGDTLHLSETLYNAGLSSDVIAACKYFRERGFDRITLIGFSLGGNVVLKAAAELSGEEKSSDANNVGAWLRGVCAVSPSIDLHACVDAIELWSNRIYEVNFLRSLKEKIRAKENLLKGRYDISKLKTIDSIRSFDDTYTAPDGGYKSAADYYSKASALHMMPRVRVPVLLIASQDDPIVPFSSFQSKSLENDLIQLLAPEHGGHAGFVGRSPVPGEPQSPITKSADRFWAEQQAAQFCARVVNGSPQ